VSALNQAAKMNTLGIYGTDTASGAIQMF